MKDVQFSDLLSIKNFYLEKLIELESFNYSQVNYNLHNVVHKVDNHFDF